MKKLMGAVVALGLAACGGPGEVSGTVAGASLTVNDAILIEATSNGMSFGTVLLSDATAVCDKVTRNVEPKGGTALGFMLVNVSETGSGPLTAGTYNIVSGNGTPKGLSAQAFFVKSAADSCADTIAEGKGVAQSGTITVDTYDSASGAKGSFALNFASGDKISGTFDAAKCAAIPSETASTCE